MKAIGIAIIAAVCSAATATATVVAIRTVDRPAGISADPGYRELQGLARVARLEKEYDQLSERCGDGPANTEAAFNETMKFCKSRDATVAELKKLGWCEGDTGWEPCPA